MEQLKAGMAQVNITPPPGVFLAGYRLRDTPAWRIQDELRATTLVVEAAGKRAVLISADLAGLPLRRVEAVRAEISRQTGISPDGVMISCSHTHSGPQTRERPHLILGTGGGWIKQTHDAYLKTLEEKLAGAAIMACKGLEPAGIGTGRGELRGCVINRRYPDGVTDPEVSVVRVEPRSGRWHGILVNFACHPTSMGPHEGEPVISPDYPGHMVRFLEAMGGPGTYGMFANGAAGNVAPWDFYFMGDDLGEGDIRKAYTHTYSLDDSRMLGRLLALEAMKVWAQIRVQDQARIAFARQPLSLRVRTWPSVEEAVQEVERCKAVLARVQAGEKIARVQKTRQDILYERQIACFYPDLAVDDWGPIIGLKYAEEGLQFVQEREKDSGRRVIETEVHAVSIGDTACVGIPGELFVEIGLAVKRASPFSHTMVFGYSNDSVGYLPTREAFPEGGYGVTWASRVTEEAEGQICVASTRALERCREDRG